MNRWLIRVGLASLLAAGTVVFYDSVTLSGVPIALPPGETDDLYDPIVSGEAFPGGIKWVVSRDGIRPIYDPEFVEADETELAPNDLVIGVDLENETKAYPVGLLAARELVIDRVGDIPILVSWCPLCGTGTVHRRTIDGETVVFGNQGALWGNAMTWFDHGTGSIWSQPLGEAIAGPLRGTRLDLLPATLTTWASWRESQPTTVVLDGPVYWSGTNLDDLAVVVEIGNQVRAFPMPTILDKGVVNATIGGRSIVVVAHETIPGGWEVYSADQSGVVLTFHLEGQLLVDDQTGTHWDPATGLGVAGNMAGQSLDRLAASTVFPKDFKTFWPEGTAYARG